MSSEKPNQTNKQKPTKPKHPPTPQKKTPPQNPPQKQRVGKQMPRIKLSQSILVQRAMRQCRGHD